MRVKSIRIIFALCLVLGIALACALVSNAQDITVEWQGDFESVYGEEINLTATATDTEGTLVDVYINGLPTKGDNIGTYQITLCVAETDEELERLTYTVTPKTVSVNWSDNLSSGFGDDINTVTATYTDIYGTEQSLTIDGMPSKGDAVGGYILTTSLDNSNYILTDTVKVYVILDTTELDNIKAENDRLQKENNELKQENGDLTAENNELKQENNTLTNENNSLKEENDALKDENTTVKGENSKLKAENGELKVENNELKAENGELKAENSNLKAENDELKKENEDMKAGRDALTVKVGELTQAINEQKSEITSLNSIIDTLKGIIENQTGKINIQVDKINTLNQAINEQKKNIDALEGRIDALTNENNSLKDNVSVLSGKIDTLTGNISSLTTENVNLQNGIVALQNENTILKGEVKGLNTEILSLKGIIEKLKEEINALKGSIDNLTEQDKLKVLAITMLSILLALVIIVMICKQIINKSKNGNDETIQPFTREQNEKQLLIENDNVTENNKKTSDSAEESYILSIDDGQQLANGIKRAFELIDENEEAICSILKDEPTYVKNYFGQLRATLTSSMQEYAPSVGDRYDFAEMIVKPGASGKTVKKVERPGRRISDMVILKAEVIC